MIVKVDDSVDGGVGVDKDVIICHMRHHAGSDDSVGGRYC